MAGTRVWRISAGGPPGRSGYVPLCVPEGQLVRSYGAGGEEMAPSSQVTTAMECRMSQPNDLSRCLVSLDQDSTLIAVIELSQSSWLIAGTVPGLSNDNL